MTHRNRTRHQLVEEDEEELLTTIDEDEQSLLIERDDKHTQVEDCNNISQMSLFEYTRKTLTSIMIMFPAIMLIALVLIVSVLTLSNVMQSKRIIREITSDTNSNFARVAVNTIREQVMRSQRTIDQTFLLMDLNTTDMTTNLRVLGSSLIVNDELIDAVLVTSYGSVAMWERQGEQSISTLYSDSTGVADVSVYNSSDLWTPLETKRVVNWSLTSQSVIQALNIKDYQGGLIVDSQTEDKLVSYSKKLYSREGALIALISFTYSIASWEDDILHSVGDSSVSIVDSRGRLVAGSEFNGFSGIVTSMYEVTVSDMDRLIQASASGRASIHINEITFENCKWNVISQWSDELWMREINYNAIVSGIVVLIIALSAIVVTVGLSIPVARTIIQTKDCLAKICRMEFEHPIIQSFVLSGCSAVTYETAALRSSLISMIRVLSSFQKYVPPVVVNRVMNRGAEAKLGLENEYCTVFFLDIRDFTKISETVPSDCLAEIMNEALEELSDILLSKDAVIDKYMGDCIMCFWPAGENQEEKACEAALLCKQALARLSAKWRRRNLPALECRIGIHSGDVLIGNYGSTKRFNFTVIGDVVNTSSRVEELNKYYGSTIMITENVLRNVQNGLFVTRRLENIQVKGKDNSIIVHELVEKTHAQSASELLAANLYNKAIEAYTSGDFSEALSIFRSIPNYERDPVIAGKVRQCTDYQTISRGSWNGVLRMEFK